MKLLIISAISRARPSESPGGLFASSIERETIAWLKIAAATDFDQIHPTHLTKQVSTSGPKIRPNLCFNELILVLT